MSGLRLEGEEYKNNFFEALWPYNSNDGKIYGVPDQCRNILPVL